MSPLKTRIYFEDEAPRIGAGWRIVEVRVGRKWIHIRDICDRSRKARLELRLNQWLLDYLIIPKPRRKAYDRQRPR